MKKLFYILSVFVALSTLTSCSSVPMTGRSQLILISGSEMMSLSQGQYKQVIGQSNLSHNQRQKAMVVRVGKRIAKAVDEFVKENNIDAKFQWEFNLIQDDKTVNAWCMPGGKIAVYTGLLKIAQDDAGLAVVMGHEVAHALARHGNERMSHGMMMKLIFSSASVLMSGQPETTQTALLSALGLGAKVGVELPFSRSHEHEADKIGMIIMARAGYNPQNAIGFWQRMAAVGGEKPPEILSTHPADENRIKAIKEHLPEAMIWYRK